MSNALDTLARRLHVRPEELPVLPACDEETVAAYDGLVDAAMKAEDAALTRALEEALGFVPRLLRPVAKKMLGGGRG